MKAVAFTATVIILIFDIYLKNGPTPTIAIADGVKHGDGIVAVGNSLENEKAINGYMPCSRNPYLATITKDESLETIIERIQLWLSEKRYYAEVEAARAIYAEYGHGRFFPFDPVANCSDLQCIGGECSDDTSKIACGMDSLGELDDCVIYSIGGNNQWEFELDLLKKTKCQIHTFDCTGLESRFHKPDEDRLHFHHVCLGAVSAKGIGSDHESCVDKRNLCGDSMTLGEIQERWGHDQIDLLKLDIEGWEWPLFDVEHTNVEMPMQLLMEVHYDAHRGVRGVIHNQTMRSATDMVRFSTHLQGMGYAVVHRDDNPMCKHCTELTLTRVAC